LAQRQVFGLDLSSGRFTDALVQDGLSGFLAQTVQGFGLVAPLAV
jgi:hypothetical protein